MHMRWTDAVTVGVGMVAIVGFGVQARTEQVSFAPTRPRGEPHGRERRILWAQNVARILRVYDDRIDCQRRPTRTGGRCRLADIRWPGRGVAGRNTQLERRHYSGTNQHQRYLLGRRQLHGGHDNHGAGARRRGIPGITLRHRGSREEPASHRHGRGPRADDGRRQAVSGSTSLLLRRSRRFDDRRRPSNDHGGRRRGRRDPAQVDDSSVAAATS